MRESELCRTSEVVVVVAVGRAGRFHSAGQLQWFLHASVAKTLSRGQYLVCTGCLSGTCVPWRPSLASVLSVWWGVCLDKLRPFSVASSSRYGQYSQILSGLSFLSASQPFFVISISANNVVSWPVSSLIRARRWSETWAHVFRIWWFCTPWLSQWLAMKLVIVCHWYTSVVLVYTPRPEYFWSRSRIRCSRFGLMWMGFDSIVSSGLWSENTFTFSLPRMYCSKRSAANTMARHPFLIWA